MATSDNQALLLQISADLSQLQKAFKKANGIVDESSASMVRSAKRGGDMLEAEMGRVGKRGGHALAKQLTAETGKAITLNRMQMMELTHVARASFDMLAAGASPMKVLTMQGAQLAQALGMGQGGVGGGLAALGGMAVEFAPIIAIVAALAAGATAVGLALHAAAEEADALRAATVTLDMMGNGAKYSAEEVAKVADGIRATGVSAKDANAELRTFIQSSIAPDRLEQFATAAREMAKVLGEDTPKAAAELSKAFTGTYNDMMSVKDVANALDDKDKAYIKTLYDSGRASEARSEAFRIFSEKVGKAYNDSLTEMDRLHNAAAGSWAALTSAMGNTSAIQAATSVINGLLVSMTNWLRQYEAIKALSDADMKAEQARLSAKLNDPNSAQNYDTAASIQNVKNKVLQSITGAHVTPVSGEMLRLQDEKRLTDIANQRLAQQAVTGDTTFSPTADKSTKGARSRKASSAPTSGFSQNPWAADLERGALILNPDRNQPTAPWQLRTGRMASDGVKPIDDLKVTLPVVIGKFDDLNNALKQADQDGLNTLVSGLADVIVKGGNAGRVLHDVIQQMELDLAQFAVKKGVSSILSFFGLPSFDGGGYTGAGARSGGIDGKGGFLSIMHPHETVTDHTKTVRSASAMPGMSAGGGAVQLHLSSTYQIVGTGVNPDVQAAIAQSHQQAVSTAIMSAKKQMSGWASTQQYEQA